VGERTTDKLPAVRVEEKRRIHSYIWISERRERDRRKEKVDWGKLLQRKEKGGGGLLILAAVVTSSWRREDYAKPASSLVTGTRPS